MDKLYILLIIFITIIISPCCKKAKNDNNNNNPVSSATVFTISLTPAHPVRGDKVTLMVHIANNSGLTLIKVKGFVRDSVSELPKLIPLNIPLLSNPTDTTYFYKYIVPQGTFIGDTIKFITVVSAKNSPDVGDTLQVIVKSAYNPITKWVTPITLYGQNATGVQNHFFASINGNSFSDINSNANANVIDITYGVLSPANGNESFISPEARISFGFSTISGATKTFFGLSSVKDSVFDILANDSLIGAIPTTLTDSTISIIHPLNATSNIYEFYNSNHKKGFIKVNSISTGSSGNVVFEVKVQQ